MNYTSVNFSLKGQHCRLWTPFVPNIVLKPNTDQRGVFTVLWWRCSPIYLLFVCLFVFVFFLVNNLMPFCFHDMPNSYSLWTTHCNQTVNKSHGPKETTFRNLEWTWGFRGLWYSGTQSCRRKWLLLMASYYHNCVFWFRKRINVKTNHLFQI